MAKMTWWEALTNNKWISLGMLVVAIVLLVTGTALHSWELGILGSILYFGAYIPYLYFWAHGMCQDIKGSNNWLSGLKALLPVYGFYMYDRQKHVADIRERKSKGIARTNALGLG
jgi:hypothetical protein